MRMHAARRHHEKHWRAKHVEGIVFPRLDESSTLSWSTTIVLPFSVLQMYASLVKMQKVMRLVRAEKIVGCVEHSDIVI